MSSISYIEIILTKDQVALVDAADYIIVSSRKWTAFGNRPGRYYARTGGKTGVAMHRLLMGLERGDKRDIDHINGNTLDNRRSNLRICLHSENVRNRRRNTQRTNGYKGTTFSKGKNKWQAQIGFEGRKIHLGYFETQEAAHAAYCDAANRYFGEFARVS